MSGFQEDMESQRLEEFFKYFVPTAHAAKLYREDIDSIDVSLMRPPDLSTDPVLNGLTQLATYRLDCDRSFISLIDDTNQFILAEMSKSISLYDKSDYSIGNGVFLGVRALTRDVGICGRVVECFIEGASHKTQVITANVFADDNRYVINDLSLEHRYAARPYVAGFPHMRFYAAVPLKTESGLVIGNLAIVDNKPRNGLSEKQFRDLTELASATMAHLNLVRLEKSHARSMALLEGLNALTRHRGVDTDLQQGLSGNTEGFSDDPTSGANDSSYVRSTPSRDDKDELTTPAMTDLHTVQKPHTVPGPVVSSDSRLESPMKSVDTVGTLDETSKTIPQASETSGLSSDATLDQAEHTTNPDTCTFAIKDQDIFQYSASILQKAMDLDGMVFIHAQGNLSEPAPDITSPPLDSNDDIRDPLGDLRETSLSQDQRPVNVMETSTSQTGEQCCEILACSVRDGNASGRHNEVPRSVPRLLYQKLAAMFPFGHVFNYHSRQRLRSQDMIVLPSHRMFKSPGLALSVNDSDHVATELDKALFSHFPDVYSLIYLPLKSTHSDKWQVGCFGWSSQPQRFLQEDELAYFTVFGNSILAEVVRIELADLNKAKSDFISSISHELRSPLHGILGSTELLKEFDVDEDCSQLIHMVENCANALLENLENILHYSKINHKPQHKDLPPSEMSIADEFLGVSKVFGDTSFDLAVLVEQCTDALVVGHEQKETWQTSPTSHGYTISPVTSPTDEEPKKPEHVLVVLQIEARQSWMIRSKTSLWRRVVMNIMGNAQKYTSEGYILIRLALLVDAPKENTAPVRATAVLTVCDTGRGISSSFLKNHLFQPFVQEQTLSPGTGLGLSIVKTMIDNEGGSIDVSSEVGQGTEVKISIPVILDSVSPEVKREETERHLSIDMIDTMSSRQNGEAASPTLIVSRAIRFAVGLGAQRCNLEVQSVQSMAASTSGTVLIIGEADLQSFTSQYDDESSEVASHWIRALVILCTAHTIQSRHTHIRSDGVYYLLPPYGPKQFENIIDRMSRSKLGPGLDIKALKARTKTSTQDRAPFRSHVPLGINSDSPPTQHPRSGGFSHGTITEVKTAHKMHDQAQQIQPEPLKILLVDDNALNLKLLCRCVEKLGIDYTIARNGFEAVKAVEGAEIPFAHILMDISMPVLNGFEAVRAIRDHERQHNQRKAVITAMTGLGNQSARNEAYASGFDTFLTKPTELRKIRLLLQNREMTSQKSGVTVACSEITDG